MRSPNTGYIIVATKEEEEKGSIRDEAKKSQEFEEKEADAIL